MTLYDLAGGRERLLAMTTAFYERAVADDFLGTMLDEAASEHAGRLAAWLSASFGGSTDDLRDRGDLRFVIWKHAGLRITEAQRARWARLMMDAAAGAHMPKAFVRPYGVFVDRITRATRAHSNADPAAVKADLGPGPHEATVPLGVRRPDIGARSDGMGTDGAGTDGAGA